MGVYRISKQLWFCAAHQVRLSEDRCENLHGHNYRVLVHAEARELDRVSYVLVKVDPKGHSEFVLRELQALGAGSPPAAPAPPATGTP